MITSVLKAIEILEAFTPQTPIMSLSELSKKLGYPKTTLYTILATLVYKGFIEHMGNGNYALGTAIISMTQAVRINVQLRDRAAPLIRELADSCRESVYLTVLDGTSCLYIYAVESPDRLLARTAIGDRSPLHCTSAGKAILSFLEPSEVKKLFEATPLESYNTNTITNLDDLMIELRESKERGYAIDNEEHEKGLFCLGSPIFNDSGNVIGSCSISGANIDILNSKKNLFSSYIRYTALEISRRMGFVPSGKKRIWNEISNPLRIPVR